MTAGVPDEPDEAHTIRQRSRVMLWLGGAVFVLCLVAGTAWLLHAMRPFGSAQPTLDDVRRLLAAHQTAAAVDALDRVLPRDAPDAAARPVLAAAYAALCDPTTGEPDPGVSGAAARIAAALQDALSNSTGTAADYQLLGEFALAGGLPAAAVPALRKAAALGADRDALQLPLALALLHADQPDRLLQSELPASTSSPHLRSMLLVVRARAQDALGQYDEEHASLIDAVSVEPGNLDALARLGLLEVARGKPDAAVAWLARAKANDPHAAATLRLDAEYDYAMHDYAGSAKDYATLVEHHAAETYEPLPPSLGEARAQIYLGELTQAAAILDGAALRASDPHVTYYRALLAFRAGEFRRAAELAEPLSATLHNFPQLDLLFGDSMLANGFPATAASSLRRYLAMVPGNSVARSLLDDADERVAHPNLAKPVPVADLLKSFGFPPTPAPATETARRL